MCSLRDFGNSYDHVRLADLRVDRLCRRAAVAADRHLRPLGEQRIVFGKALAVFRGQHLVVVCGQNQDLLILLTQREQVIVVFRQRYGTLCDPEFLVVVRFGTDGCNGFFDPRIQVFRVIRLQQPVFAFQRQNAANRCIDIVHGDLAAVRKRSYRGNTVLQPLNAGVRIRCDRHEQDIHTRVDGQSRGIHRIKMLCYGVHVHRVGHDDAVKAHITAENIRHDRFGKRRRKIDLFSRGFGNVSRGFDFRILDVRRHDHLRAGSDPRGKGDQFVFLQLGIGFLDLRQSRMTVGSRVAVAGKMLECRHDLFLVQSFDEGRSQSGNDGGIVREGTRADDGICGIVVDVHDRREIDVDPQCGKLLADDHAGSTRRRPFADRAQRHVAGQLRPRSEARNIAALLVDADKHLRLARLCVGFLQTVRQAERLLGIDRILREQDHTAERVAAEQIPKLLVELRDADAVIIPRRDHKHLCDFLLRRHGTEHAFDRSAGLSDKAVRLLRRRCRHCPEREQHREQKTNRGRLLQSSVCAVFLFVLHGLLSRNVLFVNSGNYVELIIIS